VAEAPKTGYARLAGPDIFGAMRGKSAATDYDRLASVADEYRRILRTLILPTLGSKRIVDVRRPDVAKLHGKLAGMPYEANRALALISAVWNWAARRGEVAFADNPAKAIERYLNKGESAISRAPNWSGWARH
jgi:integrase